MLEDKFRNRYKPARYKNQRIKRTGGGRRSGGGKGGTILLLCLLICAAVLCVIFLPKLMEKKKLPIAGKPGKDPEGISSIAARPEEPESLPEAPEEETGPSLRETAFGSEVTLWVDGGEVKGLVSGGVTYVNAAEMREFWPWFDWQGEGDVWRFTGKAPNEPEGAPQLNCVSPEQAESGSGIRCGKEYWLPLRWLCEQFSAKLLWDRDLGQTYVTCIPQVDIDAISGRAIPILMYHAVSDEIWGMDGLFVSPSSMRDQLQYLADNGYDPIFFSDLAYLEDYDKPVLLTYDDGYMDNYTELFPLLKEFHMKATVFVISSTLGYGHSMTAAQAKEMSDSGLVDIQSHTADHYELASLDEAGQEDQLARSQIEIARVTKKVPYVLCYPNGGHDQTTKDVGAKYYDFGILKDGGLWYPDYDRFAVTRSRVDRSHSVSEFAALLD